MLQSIHDRIKGWVAGVIIAIVALSFMLWGIQYYVTSGSSAGGAAVTVNGEKITNAQVAKTFRAMQRAQTQQTRALLTDAQNEQLQQIALQTLIMKTLLRQAAVSQGFRVSHEQMRDFIATMPAFQESGHFSETRLQQFLYSSSLTLQQFINELNNSLLLQQVSEGLQDTAFVLPDEISNAYHLYYQTRSFGYFLIPSSRFLKTVSVSQQSIQNYYKQNQKAFMAPEKVSLSYVLLSPQEIAQHVVVDAKSIKQYYQDNLSHYQTASGKSRPLAAVQKEIKRILVQQKTDAILAKQNDQLSDLTYTHPDSLQFAAKALSVPVRKTALFTREGGKESLTKDPRVLAAVFSDEVLQQSENSAPIELKNGSLVVLRVEKHQPSAALPLSQVAPKIRARLASQMATAQAALLASKLQEELQKGVRVQRLAAKNHLSWKTVSAAGRRSASAPSAIVDSAFKLALGEKYSSTVIALPNGDAAVIQLNKINSASFSKKNSQASEKMNQAMKKFNAQLGYQFYMLGTKARAKIKMAH